MPPRAPPPVVQQGLPSIAATWALVMLASAPLHVHTVGVREAALRLRTANGYTVSSLLPVQELLF